MNTIIMLGAIGILSIYVTILSRKIFYMKQKEK